MTTYTSETSTPTGSFSSSSTAFGFGNKFTVSAAFTARALSYYSAGTGDGVPTHLKLFNADSGATLADVALGSAAAAGWHRFTLSSPVSLATGTNYVAALFGPSDFQFRGWTTAPPAVNSPFTHVGCRYNNTDLSCPVGVSGFELLAISLDDATAPGTGGGDGSTGAGDPALTGDLEAWLSSDTTKNLHKTDGIPWQLKLAHDALASGLGSAITGLYKRLDDGVAWLRTHVDALPDSIQAAVDALLATLEDRFTAVNTAIANVQAAVDAAYAALDPNTGGLGATLRSTVAVPGTGWALAEETDFDRVIAWPVQADAYVLTLTAVPPGSSHVDVDGVQWRPRIGWWGPLNGTQARWRRFVEFDEQQLDNWPQRLPGVVIYLKPGTSAHLQAWTFTG